MISGLEALIKWVPAAGAILMMAVSYGEVRADIKNLQMIQAQQFQLIESQLASITSKLEEKK